MGTQSSYQLDRLKITLFEVSKKEEGLLALHLPIGHLKTRFGLDRCRGANTVPISPLADDIGTAPLGPVINSRVQMTFYSMT